MTEKLSQSELDRLLISYQTGATEIDPETNRILLPPDFMACEGEMCRKRGTCLRYYTGDAKCQLGRNLCSKFPADKDYYIHDELQIFLDDEYLLEQGKESYMSDLVQNQLKIIYENN